MLEVFLILSLAILAVILQSTGMVILEPIQQSSLSTAIAIDEAMIAFRNAILAAGICVVLNVITLTLGSAFLSRVDRNKFMSRFVIGAKGGLLISALSIAGFHVGLLDREILPGFKYYAFVPLSIIFLFAAHGFFVSRSSKSSEVGSPNHMNEETIERTRTDFMFLLVLQSVLPTAILLVPFVVVTGLTMNLGFVASMGILFLWGPGSLTYSLRLVGTPQWKKRGYLYLNLATLGVTTLGASMGVVFSLLRIVIPFQPFLLLVASLVMFVGYSIDPLGRIGSTDEYKLVTEIRLAYRLEDQVGCVNHFIENKVKSQFALQSLYLFLAPPIASIVSLLLRFGSSIEATVIGILLLSLITLFFYDFPSTWYSCLVRTGIVQATTGHGPRLEQARNSAINRSIMARTVSETVAVTISPTIPVDHETPDLQ